MSTAKPPSAMSSRRDDPSPDDLIRRRRVARCAAMTRQPSAAERSVPALPGTDGHRVPEQFGGAGGRFHRDIGHRRIGARRCLDLHYVDVPHFVNTPCGVGNETKARYFPKMTTSLLGPCLSEPASGSDAFALETRALKDGDDWLLTGRKFWITSGAEAGLFIVFANIDPTLGYKGITAFLIERDFPGFTIGKRENKLGIRASSTVELILEGCRVPGANVLGPVGQGYKISIETLNEGRIGIGAQMIGVAQGALDASVKYVKERRQFGKAIANFRECSSSWPTWPRNSKRRG